MEELVNQYHKSLTESEHRVQGTIEQLNEESTSGQYSGDLKLSRAEASDSGASKM